MALEVKDLSPEQDKRSTYYFWKDGPLAPDRDTRPEPTALEKKIKYDWTNQSLSMAKIYHRYGCDVHENCDGICTGKCSEPPTFLSYTTHTFSLMTSITSSFQKYEIELAHGPVIRPEPRDVAWVNNNEFPSYQYQSLDSSAGEIRLLCLKTAVFRVDVVECEMIKVPLGSNQKYEALSYCWGSGKKPDVMLCNGQKIMITTSLNAALKAYRMSHGHDTPIWVDAVSIHQENKAELNDQISLMRRIYTEADEVFVHLGDAELSWFQAIDLILLLSVFYKEWKRQDTNQLELQEAMHHLLPDHRHTAWSHLFSTFCTPWFKRTWILQEISLAKKARICKGRFGILGWDTLELAYRFYVGSGVPEVYRAIPYRRAEHTDGILAFSRILQIKVMAQDPRELDLIVLLDITHIFEVSDSRDKILAILGLIGELPPTLKSILNYDRSTRQIYHLTALYMLDLGCPGKLLDHAGLHRQSDGSDLPSWVPDWNSPKRKGINRPLTLFRPAQFDAGGSIANAYFRLFGGQRELGTHGFCHHKIARVSKVERIKISEEGLKIKDILKEVLKKHTSASEISEKNQNILDIILQMTNHASSKSLTPSQRLLEAKRCFDSYQSSLAPPPHNNNNNDNNNNHEENEDAFARTLLVNDLYTGQNALRSQHPISHPTPSSRKILHDLSSHPEQQEGEFHYPPGVNDEFVTYLMQSITAIQGRRFAVTEGGHMCLVPEVTEVGDAVAVILGMAVPYVVRIDEGVGEIDLGVGGRKGVYAKLVGDCYAHGMMEGEVLEEAVREERDFSLIVFD